MSNIPFSQQSFSIPPNLNIESITSDIGNFDELFIADLEIEDLELSNLIVNNSATFNTITGDSAEITLVGSQTTATNLLTNNDITTFINVDKDLILTHVGSAINCSNVNSVNANISSILMATDINSSGTSTLNIADITTLNTDIINPTTANIITANITTGNITTVNSTTGNITTINSTTGNITNIDSDSASIDTLTGSSCNITNITCLTTDAEIIKTNGINSSGTPNLTTVCYSNLSGAFDNTFVRFNEYRCRLNTTNPMLFDAVQGVGGIPIKLNTSLPFLAPETFVFQGDQMSLESGNKLIINSLNQTKIHDLEVDSISHTNSTGNIEFNNNILLSFGGGTVYARVGGFGDIQSFGGSATNINCLDNMTFSSGKYIYGERIYLDYIIKNPSASWLKIQNLSDDEGVIFQTKRTGLPFGEIRILNNEIDCFVGGTTTKRRLYINLTSDVQVDGLRTENLQSTSTGSIRLFSNISSQSDSLVIYCRIFANSSLTNELVIASNVPQNSAINLQTRASGYTINNIRILGNTLFSTRNGSTPTNIVANPSISNSSDIRLKEEIEPLTNGLGLINQLNIKKYQKKAVLNKSILKSCEEDECFDCDCYMNHRWLEYGLIAQEVLETDLSFAVDTPADLENNPYTLNYNMIYNVNLLATQELHKLILDQQAEIIELKKDITQNQKLVNLILSKIDI